MPTGVYERGAEPLKRLLSNVKKTKTCWWWTGSINSSGYGGTHMNGKDMSAHRAFYELFKGPIPKGLFVCHTCDNRACVNPDHLWLGTNQDNVDDKMKKGRGPHGKNNSQVKLTEKQVLEIRAKYVPYKYTMKRLAKEYGVTMTNIQAIIERRSWNFI